MSVKGVYTFHVSRYFRKLQIRQHDILNEIHDRKLHPIIHISGEPTVESLTEAILFHFRYLVFNIWDIYTHVSLYDLGYELYINTPPELHLIEITVHNEEIPGEVEEIIATQELAAGLVWGNAMTREHGNIFPCYQECILGYEDFKYHSSQFELPEYQPTVDEINLDMIPPNGDHILPYKYSLTLEHNEFLFDERELVEKLGHVYRGVDVLCFNTADFIKGFIKCFKIKGLDFTDDMCIITDYLEVDKTIIDVLTEPYTI